MLTTKYQKELAENLREVVEVLENEGVGHLIFITDEKGWDTGSIRFLHRIQEVMYNTPGPRNPMKCLEDMVSELESTFNG